MHGYMNVRFTEIVIARVWDVVEELLFGNWVK